MPRQIPAHKAKGSVQKTKLHNSVVTPPYLTWSASLREFDAWRHKFEGYASLANINTLKPSEQQTALGSLVDEEWTRMLRFGLDIKEDSELNTVLDAMEKHLRSRRNVVLDRREFYLRKQESGENFDEFLCAIKEIAAFCGFCEECMDNRLRDRIVVGTSDELALQRLLEEKDLTLQKAIDICRSTENAAKNSAVIRGRSVGKVSQYKRNMQR